MNDNPIHKIKARIWEWEDKGSWHFITIEKDQGQQIKNDWHWLRRGFGSIPVKVSLSSSVWQTSIFPEKGGSYLLPLKKVVREKEKIKKGDTITLELEVLS